MTAPLNRKPFIPAVGVEALADFIAQAPAGAEAVYHIGNLAEARVRSQRADLAARVAAQAAAARKVFLTQRPHRAGGVEYIIRKRWPSCPRRG